MKRKYCIIAAVDLSPATEIVLERALDEASRHDGAEVHVVAVGDLDKLEDIDKELRSRASETSSAFDGDLGTRPVTLHVRTGKPAEAILELADEAEADMIVVGKHGWGRDESRRLGSVPRRLLRDTRCSILVVQPRDYLPRDAEPEEQQCEDCVEVRRETEGEQWFCARHKDDTRARHFLIPQTGPSLHPGGGLW